MSFDEPNLGANAGLLLVGTLALRRGLEQLVNATVLLGARVGGARPGRKVLTLVHAIVAGGPRLVLGHFDVLAGHRGHQGGGGHQLGVVEAGAGPDHELSVGEQLGHEGGPLGGRGPADVGLAGDVVVVTGEGGGGVASPLGVDLGEAFQAPAQGRG